MSTPSLISNIKSHCLTSIILFLILGIANFSLQEQLFKKNQADNKMISITNNQLGLIQQSFFLSEQLVDSKSPDTKKLIRQKLGLALKNINKNDKLLFEDKRNVLPEIREIYYRKPVFLEKKLKGYTSLVMALTEEPDQHLNRDNVFFQELHQNEEEQQFEDIFHDINRILQEESRQANIRMEPLGYMLLGINILMLICAWSFIFSPMIRYIRTKQNDDLLTQQKLQEQNSKLEETQVRLQEELAKRIAAEEQLLQANSDLEYKVENRTKELSLLNGRLQEELVQRNTLESQLIQAQKMESIGQLAAGVAHEINNPIGFVKSNLSTLKSYVQSMKQLIANYQSLDPWLREQIDKAHVEEVLAKNDVLSFEEDLGFVLEDSASLIEESQDGINRVQEIVKGLKTFARADEESLLEADINSCIESTLRIIWNEVKYKCTVDKQLAPLPMIYCFPSQLNQVFMNLIVNAAQAIDKQGTITLKTSATPSEIHIEISDTGSGIPKEHLDKIFDPFFTTKPVGKGTGLGLAISYGIIEKHKGRIEIESEIGAGTTFKIRLPILDKDELRPSIQTSSSAIA